MIAFDFLYDPRTVLLERVRAFKMTKSLLSASTALVTVSVVIVAGWSVQHARIVRASEDVAALETTYATVRERLVRERLEAGEVADLGSVDGRLRAIASSGAHARDRLIAVATVLPNAAWLVSLADDGKHVVMIGRTTSLSVIAIAIARLGRARMGAPTLSRVARVERSGRPLLEFSLSLDET